jgi:hypothetical protein
MMVLYFTDKLQVKEEDFKEKHWKDQQETNKTCPL